MSRSVSRPFVFLLVLLVVFAAVAFSRPAPVRAQAVALSNTMPITIPGFGAATPYPSTIEVSGPTGLMITDVDVTLTGLSHTWPSDLDILLAGPGGQHVMLLSDAGRALRLSGANLIFDDAAPPLPMASTPVVSGTYRPTNFAGTESFAAPAPAAPYGTTLSVFDGTSPNGTWSLFVVDDAYGDKGRIAGGWSLTITTVPDTSPPVLTVPADLTVEATIAAGAIVTYSASATDDVDGTLTPSCELPSGSTFPLGTTTVTCDATDSAGNTGTVSFTITVQDTTAPLLTLPGTMSALATSPSGAVVSYSASAIDDIDDVVPVTCAPPSGSTLPIGITTVPCTATDSAGNTSTASFQVSVAGPTISTLSPNRMALNGPAQTITIRGANFVTGATVTVGAKTYAATVVSSTELRVSVVPRDVFLYGWLVVPTANVTVVNPGGVKSNSLTLYLAW
jgi:subtilisin-like proprotein convertase family protein